MHREGHVGAALVAYAPLVAVTSAVGLDGLALAGGFVVAGLAMLPDVDMKLPLVAHRGPTHTVRFAVAVAAALGIAGVALGASDGLLAAVGLGVFGALVGAVAVGSHIAADALTPMGVEPFDDGRRYSYSVARASNPLANYALLALGVLAVAVGYGLGSAVAALAV